jgi:hypothetical protein
MIRRTIVELFKRDGVPPSPEKVASEIGLSRSELTQRLAQEEKLDDLCGVSLKQAFELIEFYGPSALFTDAITENVQGAVLVKQKLNRIEEKKRGGNPPPASDKK